MVQKDVTLIWLNTMKTIVQESSTDVFPAGLKVGLSSSDVDEMREQSIFWPIEIKQLGRGRFQGDILGVHTTHLQLSTSTRSLGVSIRGAAPADTSVISFLLDPEPTFSFRGQPLLMNQALAIRDNEDLEITALGASRLVTLVCRTKLIEAKTLLLTGQSFDQLRSQERLFFDPAEYQCRAKRLLSMVHTLYARQEPLSGFEESLVEDEILQIALVGILPSEDVARKPGRLMLAKKAEAFILDNLEAAPSIADLCSHVGCSERTLHLGFKERFGLSPKAYVLLLRLNGVHEDLRAAGTTRTITEVAMDWGFFHLGRFSQQYTRLFTQSPRRTCQQVRWPFPRNN